MKKLSLVFLLCLLSSNAFAIGEVLKLTVSGSSYTATRKLNTPASFSRNLTIWIKDDNTAVLKGLSSYTASVLRSTFKKSKLAVNLFSGSAESNWTITVEATLDKYGYIKTLSGLLLTRGLFESNSFANDKVTAKLVGFSTDGINIVKVK